MTLLALTTACGDDGTAGTETMESTGGSTGSETTTTTSTDPTTTINPTTTTDTTGTPDTTTTGTTTTTTDTTSATTDTTTTDETTGTTGTTEGSTTEGSTGTTEGSTGDVDLCVNGQQDGDETDVDCGGPACNDCGAGQMCLVNDDCDTAACDAGVCIVPECLTDEDCAGVADACNTGACDLQTFTCAKQPANEGMGCVGADLCTTGDVCTAGVCGGGQPKDCAALNTFCGLGVCDPQDGQCITGPNPEQDGKDCDDNNACTAATTCGGGFCGDPNNPGYAFHENFSDPDPNWKTDQGWQFGAAVVSPAGEGGTGIDPADDHSSSDDKKLAGQFIGGLITADNVTLSQFNCLTSPMVDTSNLPTVWVTFWRHAHLDYTNFVVNRLEAWNGNSWVLIEQGYPNAVTNDVEWKEIKFDVTAHKNAQFQFRICHQRNSGAYNHGGWSIDDLTIGENSCTP